MTHQGAPKDRTLEVTEPGGQPLAEKAWLGMVALVQAGVEIHREGPEHRSVASESVPS